MVRRGWHDLSHDLSDELRLMGDLASRVADAFPADAVIGPRRVADAQALDELQQRLTGLETFLRRLAAAAPDLVIPLDGPLAALTLASQAARLSGGGAEPAPSGVLELF